MIWKPDRKDLLFLVSTYYPESRDPNRTADMLQGDDQLLEALLDDERLFQRLVSDEEVLVRASPRLFFTILIRRAWRDLQGEAYTVERRSQQKVVLFDADHAARLLSDEAVRTYLAAMMASFTKVESVTVPVRVRRGVWRKHRTSDLDVESLIRYAEALDPDVRFEPYRRVADLCLFLAGVFPEFVEAQHRYPLSGEVRPRMRGRLLRTLEDHERYGQAFYRLASEQERARIQGLEKVLALLSEDFVLAEKPLSYVAQRYLRFSRHSLFDL
jgi:hypothetical protein